MRSSASCFALLFVLALLPSATGCGPSTPAPKSGGTEGGQPKGVVDDTAEEWIEEVSEGVGGKATSIREYTLDVTKTEGVKGPFQPGAGTDKIRNLRVTVRFPVPKISPPGAREPHAVNRLVWEARKELAKCFYKGAGKEPGAELSMVGWMDVKKSGDVASTGVERADEALKSSPGLTECIVESLKVVAFSPVGDDTKIRFKLKFQTTDVTGSSDVKAPPPKEK